MVRSYHSHHPLFLHVTRCAPPPQSVFLAGVPAAGLSGLVHLRSDQQQGQRRPAEGPPHLRRGPVRPAAGDLPLRLLQAAQVSPVFELFL